MWVRLGGKFFLLLGLSLLLAAGCSRPVQVDRTDPAGVARQFIQAQAAGDRATVNALLNEAMRQRFKKDKLYLADRLKLQDAQLAEQEAILTYDTDKQKVFELKYAVKTRGRERPVSLQEAISLVPQEGEWLIGDYARDDDV